MKSMYRAATVAILVTIILMNPALMAGGNPPPGRWEKVIDTKTGGGITVYTKDGAGQKCRFQSVDAQLLICADRDGNIVQIEKASIDKVTLNVRGKHIKRGLLFGILGGVAITAGLLSQGDSDYAGAYIGLPPAYGAAAGSLIGAVVPGSETIYISKEAAQAEVKQP